MIETHAVTVRAASPTDDLAALRRLQALDGPCTWVQVFGPAEAADAGHPLQHAIGALRATFPRSVVTGCSAAAAVQGAEAVDDRLVVSVSRFQSTRLRVCDVALQAGDGTLAAAQAVARAMASVPQLQAVFVLADGLQTDGDVLADALSAHLPPGVAVTGGLAADAGRFEATWVLGPGGMGRGRIVAVGLAGERLTVRHGMGAGFGPLGPLRTISAADGSLLQRLDDEPALEVYRRYLGPRAAGLPGTALQFPLELQRPGEAPIVRTVLGIDEAQGAIRFAGAMPPGCLVRLLSSNAEQLVEGAEQAARDALQGSRLPALVTVVSCIGRRLVMGPRVEDELEAVAGIAPPGSLLQGFYSFGELVPVTRHGPARLHNQSLSVTALYEL